MTDEITWDCTNCWQSFEWEGEVAEKRLEKTTVYTSEDEFEAYVCTNCGGLIDPLPEVVV